MATSSGPDDALVRAIPMEEIQGRMVEALEANDETGVANALDIALSQAAYHGASDLHMEPWTNYMVMHYRLDGMLNQVAVMSLEFQPKIIARIKVMANMVVYRRDVPQDGRIDRERTSCGRPMRISTIPTIRGEKIVIRLLGESENLFHVESLGFQPNIVDSMREIISRPQGCFLLTGPSSSGKTSTIYALLREMLVMHEFKTNVVTIEDPVEYNMDRISQVQVNPHVEFTFANALRSILRQDPEVIMVGEIRDQETAHIAIQAGLTGHFVISTIHSGTAAGVFTRLIDMGIEPFLVSSSVTGVLAQRLIRLNCPECTKKYKPSKASLEFFGLSANSKAKFFKGEGCDTCYNIGYRGRASIGELLLVTQAISDYVLTRPTSVQLEEIAIDEGMETLADDGLFKAQQGITSLEELIRVMPTMVQ